MTRFNLPPLVPLAVVYILLLIVLHTGAKPLPSSADPSHLVNPITENGIRAEVTGIISGFPAEQTQTGKSGFTTFVIKLKTLNNKPQNGRLLAKIYELNLPLQSGDYVRLWGFLSLPNGGRKSLNPGSFDYAGSLANKGIFTLLFVKGGNWEYLQSGNIWNRLTNNLRSDIIDCFSNHLTQENASVVSGVTLGVKPNRATDLSEYFIRSGTMHYMVASGSNVGFVVLFWLALGKWLLKLPHKWVAAGTLPWVLIYVSITGAEAPVVRSGIMVASGVAAYLLKRDNWPYQALLLSAMIILVFKPMALFEAGFQMSYTATLAIMTAVHIYGNFLARRGFLFKVMRTLWFMLLTSLAAQICMTPILAWYFQRISPVGLISNLIVGPIIAVCMFAGFGLYTISIIKIGWLANFLSLITNASAGILVKTVKMFAALPQASKGIDKPDIIGIIGFYILAVPILLYPKKLKLRYRLLTACAGCILVISGWLLPAGYLPNKLRITWLDTGRNYLTVIEPPGSKAIVIGELPQDNEPSRKVKILNAYLTERRKQYVYLSENLKPGTAVNYGKLSIVQIAGGTYKLTYGDFTASIPYNCRPPININGALTWTTNGHDSQIITY